MNKINTIIFDLDGTLIDSSDGVVEAVNYSLIKMGEPPQPPEAIKPFIGYPLSKMYPHFSNVPVKDLYRHFQVKAAETVVSSTVILPGVENTLAELFEAGYEMAIATTKIRIHVEGIIDKFGWHHRFSTYAGGDEVENVKPAPDIFKLIMTRLNAGSHNSIVVGDTENDIIAAKKLNLPVVAVKSPYDGHDKIKKLNPDYLLDSIKGLPDILNRINHDD